MHASTSHEPSPGAQVIPSEVFPVVNLEPAPQGSRKRKRAPAREQSSPPAADVPSDAFDSSDVLSTRSDLAQRPRLKYSRGPVFVPIAEDSEFFKTDLVGPSKLGWRYSPAGLSEPGHILTCHTIETKPTCYRVSWEDRSPMITVSKDGLRLLGHKGFRSARCNAPVREGKWYLEVEILNSGDPPEPSRRDGNHVRLGWCRRESPLNAPVGVDGYGYGYRDKTGEKVTLSHPVPYGKPFRTGDVIGMYISLPPRRQAVKNDPHDPAHFKRERIPIDLKGQEIFEVLEYRPSPEMIELLKNASEASRPATKKAAPPGKAPPKAPQPVLRPLPTLPDSHIAFFVNGESQGVAFDNLYDYLQLRSTETSIQKSKRKLREGVKEHRENPFDDGTLGYYPVISLYNDASVRINPGPNFAFPPPPDLDALLFHPDENDAMDETQTWRPACERYQEFMQEQRDLDEQDEAEAKVEAIKHAAAAKAEAAKKEQRQKRKAQADARKRAKAAGKATTPALGESLRTTPYPDVQPSPLRYSVSYDGADEQASPGAGSSGATPFPEPSPLRQSSLSEPVGAIVRREEEMPSRPDSAMRSGCGSEGLVDADQDN
ncbi:hypothetical protein FISHEDRAFT_37656 [Fistulina hepatica ATCC 64428]|nr:hypothetical protein FISHEDRAFT_37656 [Fistulina hepatica ATCC 64428]